MSDYNYSRYVHFMREFDYYRYKQYKIVKRKNSINCYWVMLSSSGYTIVTGQTLNDIKKYIFIHSI